MLDVLVLNMRIRLYIFKAFLQPSFEDESRCFFADMINEKVNGALPLRIH